MAMESPSYKDENNSVRSGCLRGWCKCLTCYKTILLKDDFIILCGISNKNCKFY